VAIETFLVLKLYVWHTLESRITVTYLYMMHV